MQRLRHRISCSTIAAALFVVGCNRASETPPAPPPAGAEASAPAALTMDSKSADESERADDTSAIEAATPLAADVPLYGPAPPISSMSSPQRGTVVNLRTDDAAEQVSAWYGTELPARGWELEKQSGVAGSYLVIAHKGGRKATVLITAGSPGTQILITVLEDR